MRVGVDLHRDAAFSGTSEHRVHVELVRLAGKQEPTRRMADDGYVRVIQRRQHARGHGIPIEAEAIVYGCDHEVQPIEHPRVVIDPSILENVGLDALEDANALELVIQRVYLVRLPLQGCG